MRKLIIAPICLVLCCACGIRAETDDRRIVHSGDLAILMHGNSADVPLAVSKSDAHALAHAVETGDKAAVQAMVTSGRAIVVPSQTRVRVTEETYNERRVEVSEGAMAGKTGWAPFEWLRFRRA